MESNYFEGFTFTPDDTQTESIFTAPEPAPKPTDNRDALTKAASHFHKAPDNGEPDWQAMLLNAKNGTEKFRIRAARDAYQEEVKFNQAQARQDAEAAHIASVLATPNRNKFFWENLKKTDPRTFYSVEAQRQQKADKGRMGLAFHLKGK